LVKYSDELAIEDPTMNINNIKRTLETLIIITNLLRSQ